MVVCWCGYLSGREVQTCTWPSWCHCHSLSFASVKSRLVFFCAMLCIRSTSHGPVSVCLSFPSFCYSFPSVIFCPSSFCFPSVIPPFAFIACTLLVGRQEGHPACKKTECLGAGVVVCLERGADLHMAQLMPLLLTVWYRLIQLNVCLLYISNYY